MKIQLEVNDLDLLASALSHVLIAYNDVVSAEYLGLSIPNKFERYFLENGIIDWNERIEYLKKRKEVIKNILEQIEKEIQNGNDNGDK